MSMTRKTVDFGKLEKELGVCVKTRDRLRESNAPLSTVAYYNGMINTYKEIINEQEKNYSEKQRPS